MTDLLGALNALTKPTRRKFIQDNPDGPQPTKMVEVVDAPLLEQLDAAIRGTVGVGGSGSLPNERNMLNGDAFERMRVISGQVNGWARMAGAVVDKDSLSNTLRTWHAKFIGTPREAHVVAMYTGTMNKWAAQIIATLNPPRQRDLPNACPVCSADTWWMSGNEYPRPLILTFHDGPDMIDNGKGMCRACEAVFGMRELSYAIDEAEAKIA
ncbi:hypothetical protein E3T54_02865 [Cryobacterium sp. Sr8]|uniref:DUF7341 domain-containing protein n=1 Tax=Cryobacterium sp. Sr8 TaxID=1259203 RepID=UPI0010694A06|nr:hypothetical protein [Cryobacterium sp. Sr8]TFD80700.1 hypothetical protein E3T54_02865 [Cryobacterium sp. Sr8]